MMAALLTGCLLIKFIDIACSREAVPLSAMSHANPLEVLKDKPASHTVMPHLLQLGIRVLATFVKTATLSMVENSM